MTEVPYWRVLAIKVAAAGPYKIVDRCFYCQADEALASFQPAPFANRVACCRRCRQGRTGVPDDRGLIRGTAAVSRPSEEPTPVRIAGLIPSILDSSRPLSEIHMHPKDAAEVFGLDVDAIFAPWGSNPGETPDLPGDADQLTADILALTDLDAQLDAVIADMDRRRDEALIGGPLTAEGILSSSTDPAATSADVPALTLEAFQDLKARYGRKLFRIIAGCPLFPSSSAFEWPRRAILFVGSEVLDALAREADRTDAFARVIGRTLEPGERRMFGLEVEPWGSKDDHQTLALELARELDPS